MGNEENGYPVHDLNKTMINDTKEPSDTHIKTLKQEILDITEKFLEKILNTKNKEHEKTPKQINELRENFNKHQSETKDIIKGTYMN
jgi:TRAP-type mannitol/chloroaromatic compound transport system substrate-binding protein